MLHFPDEKVRQNDFFLTDTVDLGGYGNLEINHKKILKNQSISQTIHSFESQTPRGWGNMADFVHAERLPLQKGMNRGRKNWHSVKMKMSGC